MPYPRLIATLVVCLFLSLTAVTPALAASEIWGADPKTGGKICLFFLADGVTLGAVSWSGPLVDGKAEGHGQLSLTYKDKSGKETKGQADADMKAGKFDGRVSMKWSDGDTYEGFYKEGRRDGQGVYRWANGMVYDGEWKASAQSGKGVFRWPDGQVYEGDWLSGKQDGQGRMKFANGQSYEGVFVAGVREGRGVYRWPDGQTYEGDWRNDAPEGKGVFKFNDGRVYEGDFLKGQRHGQGVLRDAAGKVVYDGEWRDDQPYSGPPKVDKILGILWGASEDEAKKIMLARPGTFWNGVNGGPDHKWHTYIGTYNEEMARIQISFYKGKMFSINVDLFTGEDQIMDKFDTVKKGLTQRYGQPYSEQGKYIDSKAYWDLGGGYNAAVVVINRSAFMSPQANVPDFMKKPFSATISYWHIATQGLVNNEATQKTTKDY